MNKNKQEKEKINKLFATTAKEKQEIAKKFEIMRKRELYLGAELHKSNKQQISGNLKRKKRRFLHECRRR